MATGRRLFAHMSYGAPPMDDIAGSAGVTSGLVPYYRGSRGGHHLSTAEGSLADLRARAAGRAEVPWAWWTRRTVDGRLRHAQRNETVLGALVTGGVGSVEDGRSARQVVRADSVDTIADGGYAGREVPPLARLASLGSLRSVEWIAREGVARERVGDQVPEREEVGAELPRSPPAPLATIGEFEPIRRQPSVEGPLPSGPLPKGPVLWGRSAEA